MKDVGKEKVLESESSLMFEENFSAVVSALAAGDPAIFPTDTVMGLGVAVCAADGPDVLYDLKNREHNKPIAWLVANRESLDYYGENVPAYAHVLAQAYWPGALTLIVKASAAVPARYASKDGAIGLRMPARDLTLALIRAVGCPVATTSANISGMGAPADSREVDAQLVARVGAVLADDDEPRSGVASTVVDCTQDTPRILREGSITHAQVMAHLS